MRKEGKDGANEREKKKNRICVYEKRGESERD